MVRTTAATHEFGHSTLFFRGAQGWQKNRFLKDDDSVTLPSKSCPGRVRGLVVSKPSVLASCTNKKGRCCDTGAPFLGKNHVTPCVGELQCQGIARAPLFAI